MGAWLESLELGGGGREWEHPCGPCSASKGVHVKLVVITGVTYAN